MQNYPNPFNAGTQIKYSLENPSHITIQIVNLLGENIRSVDKGFKNAGNHVAHWNGKDDSHIDSPSGIYFVVAETATQREIRKILLVK